MSENLDETLLQHINTNSIVESAIKNVMYYVTKVILYGFFYSDIYINKLKQAIYGDQKRVYAELLESGVYMVKDLPYSLQIELDIDRSLIILDPVVDAFAKHLDFVLNPKQYPVHIPSNEDLYKIINYTPIANYLHDKNDDDSAWVLDSVRKKTSVF